MILCYELSDQEALTLHQVKARDVRAFAASKAFQSGVSLEQSLSACHRKSCNTSTLIQSFSISVQWWLLSRSTTRPRKEEIVYKYVYMYILYICGMWYISILTKKKKKRQKLTCFLWAFSVLFVYEFT